MAAPAEVVERVSTGDLPGAPNVGTPPTPGQPAALKARLDQEYVAGGGWAWFANYIRSLPWAIDDVTTDFGDDLYERMLLDPHVAADVSILKASILETGLNLSPAKPDKEQDGHELAVEICDNATRMLEQLSTPLDDVLWNMLDAIALGNKVAEQVYAQDSTYTGRTQLVLQALKVKPRRSTAFVVDVFYNLVGLLGLVPGQGSPVQVSTILSDPNKTPNLLPREKFAVLTFRPKDGDPRGTSIIRPVYNVWWIKTQLWAQYLKYLTQFAGASLIGYTSQDAQSMPVSDSDGNPSGTLQTPEQVMLAVLQQFQNGTAAAFPFGSKVEAIEVHENGQAFLDAFSLLNSEITKGILTQTLATEEGKHSTRAAAGVHKDILDTIVRQGKHSTIRMIRHDVLRLWVKYNYGAKAAQELVPSATLGETESEDFPATAAAVAQLQRFGYLHPSQFPGLDQRMDLPERDPDWQDDPAPEVEQIVPGKVDAQEGTGKTEPENSGKGAKAA